MDLPPTANPGRITAPHGMLEKIVVCYRIVGIIARQSRMIDIPPAGCSGAFP
jgi:hypothetical protein